MQEDMDEMIRLQLTRPLALLLSQVCPKKYEKCIVYKKCIPVISLRFKNSLYVTLQESMLFYKDHTGTLK